MTMRLSTVKNQMPATAQPTAFQVASGATFRFPMPNAQTPGVASRVPALLAVALLVLAPGCSRWKSSDPAGLFGGTDSSRRGGETQPIAGPGGASTGAAGLAVNVDGANITLSNGQVAATKSADFTPRLQTMLGERRRASAREFVQRQPDVALEVLRQALAESQSTAALEFTAQAYDQLLGVPGTQGWSAAFKAEPARRQAYATARATVLDGIRQGKISDSQIRSLVGAASALNVGVVKIDAHRTAGIANLVRQQTKTAIDSFRAASELAAQCDPYQEASNRLLLSDALRRDGQVEAAIVAWRESVERAAQLCVNRPTVFDPVYWDNAAYLRSVQTTWPDNVVAALRRYVSLPSESDDDAAAVANAGSDSVASTNMKAGDNSTAGDTIATTSFSTRGKAGALEALVWLAIGQALLDRGDHDAALVACKRAETNADDDSVRGWARVAQANALARLGQSSAATAILAGLAGHSDGAVAAAATATLGTIKLAAADSESGFRLLRKAIESRKLEGWSGLADTEADYGLALLLRGDEQAGLEHLHSAQARYQANLELAQLSRCLANEGEYWRHKKNKQRVSELLARLDGLERQ